MISSTFAGHALGNLLALIALIAAQESRYNYTDLYLGPYKHIYPPTDIAQDPGTCTPQGGGVTCPLFIAVMFSFGGSYISSGVIPSMQLAIDQMNDDPNFLPGHRLHLLVQDSQVKAPALSKKKRINHSEKR